MSASLSLGVVAVLVAALGGHTGLASPPQHGTSASLPQKDPDVDQTSSTRVTSALGGGKRILVTSLEGANSPSGLEVRTVYEEKPATYSECRAHAATQNSCDPVVCGDAADDDPGEVPAVWLRERAVDSDDWSEWRIVPTTCPDPLQERVDAAWAEAKLTAPPVTIIDGRGWTFVQINTVTFTDGTPQTFAPTLGGTKVEIRATPLSYDWDFGDETRRLTTTVPGGPYPNKTVTHRYTTLGTYTTTLTITWQAHYRAVGTTTWLRFNGQNTTTSTSAPVTTYEARSRLVDEPLPH